MKTGDDGFERLLERLSHAFIPTIEKVPVAAVYRVLTEGDHEVGAVDALDGVSLQPPDPDCRHAVWSGEEGLVQDGAEGGVLLRFHDSVDARDTDVTVATALEQLVRLIHCVLHGDRAYAYAEQVCPGWRGWPIYRWDNIHRKDSLWISLAHAGVST